MDNLEASLAACVEALKACGVARFAAYLAEDHNAPIEERSALWDEWNSKHNTFRDLSFAYERLYAEYGCPRDLGTTLAELQEALDDTSMALRQSQREYDFCNSDRLRLQSEVEEQRRLIAAQQERITVQDMRLNRLELNTLCIQAATHVSNPRLALSRLEDIKKLCEIVLESLRS